MTGGNKGSRAATAVALAFLMVLSVVAPVGAATTATTAGNDTAVGETPTSTGTDSPTVTDNQSTPVDDEKKTEKKNNPSKTPSGKERASPKDNGATGPDDNESVQDPQDREPEDGAGDDNQNVSAAAPVLKHAHVVDLTRNLSVNNRRGITSQIERAHDRFNDSLTNYRGPVRINESAAFTDDAVGIRALAHLTRTDKEAEARRIADLVYSADNETATATVEDARRALNRYGDEMDNQGLRISAEKHLENAERALERGQSVRKADGRRYFGERAQSLTQLRQAHRHANLAMRFVDREIAPDATVTTEHDPVWDGTGNRTYTVRGNLSTVRPSTIENVTVTINGNRSVEADTNLVLTEPGTTASYVAELNLTERVNRIEVTVTDGASDGGNKPGQQGTAVLRLDGDGLAESYENRTAGTDPLDPNSNSTVTAVDESTNESIDGREDFDGDRLTTIEERDAGTDPHEADTDGDDLTDWQELRVVGLDPLEPDSDSVHTDVNESDNGVTDGAEDLDGDGLTNAQEFANGSSPVSVDGDADGLNDTREIELGTDPLDPDTDDDFLQDALELQDPYNTDPLDPDTDGDGVLDGNETYTTSVRNESVGTTVEVTGSGNAAAGTVVRNETAPGIRNNVSDPARASEFVTYGGVDDPSNATIAIEYDEGALPTNESDIAVYRMNRSNGALERLNTTVDAENDTAKANTTDTVGTVAVMSPTALDEQFPDPDEIEEATINRTEFNESEINDCTGECSIDDGSISIGPLDDGASTNDVSTQSSGISSQSGGVSILASGTFNEIVDTVSVPDDATEATVDVSISASAGHGGGAGGVSVDGSTIYTITSGDDPESVSRSATVSVSGGDTITVKKFGNNVDISASVSGTSFTYGDDGGGSNPGDGGGTKTDRCAATDEYEDDPCPDSSAAPVTIDFPSGASQADTVEIEIEGSVEMEGSSSASVSLSGATSDTVTWTSDSSVQESWSLRNVDLTSDDEIELELETQGKAVLDLDRIYVWQDTDGDGFSDRLETTGFHTAAVGHVTTDPASVDTDNDGLDDDEEIIGQASGARSVLGQWKVASDPTDEDTDDDKLDDKTERDGIPVSIPERPDVGGHYNLTWGSHTKQNFTVSPSPLFAHSDTDGLNDTEEVRELSTNATSDVTYEMTEEHQQYLDDLMNSPKRLRFSPLAGPDDVGHPAESRLTDATDDFDYVFDDTTNDSFDRFTFHAIDGTNRSDIWLSNYEEVKIGTDPWDPDSDDDGLTDGWEVRDRIPATNPTERLALSGEVSLDPMDADSDGDGYWDGWIGVYGVNRSDNAILYREHLRHGGGVTGDEIVSEQVGIHNVTGTNVDGADLFGNGTEFHSNVHVGELHWGTADPVTDGDPMDPAITPSPSLTFEVDHDVRSFMNETQLETNLTAVERNYALYGMNVGFDIDQEVSRLETTLVAQNAPPYSRADLDAVRSAFHDDKAERAYMFVTTNSTGGNNQGRASRRGGTYSTGYNFGTAMFVDELNSNNFSIHFQKTATHEVGHLLDAGFNDENSSYGDDIYSGENIDPTPEDVIIGQNPIDEWSVMAKGLQASYSQDPMNETYIPFSIEEWFTIDLQNIDSVDR